MRLFPLVFLLLLTACPSRDRREPSSLPQSISVFSMPVRLICSAPATSQGIFQFSGEGKNLIAEFRDDKEARIHGKATVLLRDQGETSAYEGSIQVEGTRSPDAKTYRLRSNVDGEQWVFELRRDGDSTIWRHHKGISRTYHSNCTEQP